MLMTARFFNWLFFILFGSYLLSVLYFSWQNQPLDGGLTRIGAYSEVDYGWHHPQIVFPDILFTKANYTQDYDRHYDVVILGDSFVVSRPNATWVNYLVEKTGLSVISFHHEHFSPNQIIHSPQFQKTPPQFFIYESVERIYIDRINSLDSMDTPLSVHASPVVLALTPQPIDKIAIHRPISQSLEKAFPESINFIYNWTKRVIFNRSEVVKLNLKTDITPLFSSQNQVNLLVYAEDFEKQHTEDERLQTAAEKKAQLENYVSSNGITRLIVLVFPDKSTVYQAYLQADEWEQASIFERMKQQGTPLLNLDEVMKTAVQAGQQDVYLPNDTHTGSIGYELAAQLLIDDMVKE